MPPSYEILDELHRGSRRAVYKARHLERNRIVAVKTVLPGIDERDLEQFRIEATALARVQHPNSVGIFEVGQRQGLTYLILEFIQGGNLATKIAGIPQPPRYGAALVETSARAIHYAHERGVVHRDLKPAKILLDAHGNPHVAGFTLAKLLDCEHRVTEAGTIVGTPSYMAPEQAIDPNLLAPAADIYGLGAILYEMLTGRPPFHATTPADTLKQVVSMQPAPPSRLNPSLPRDLETICLKCLQKKPTARYESAMALADDLQRFLESPKLGGWWRAWKRS